MTSTPVPAPEVPEMSSIGRVFGAVVSPKATFESIARRPTWLVPVILGSVLFIAAVAAISYRGGWPSYMQKQVEKSAQFQQLPPDQQQRILQTQIKYAPIGGYIEGVLFPASGALLLAAIFMATFNTVLGTTLRFVTCLGVVSYAYIPRLIAGLLGILVILLKDPTTIDVQNLVASNVGSFMPEGTARWLVALLGSLDIFSFWFMILLAIGFRAAAAPKKISFGGSFATILFLWGIFVLIKVGLASLGVAIS